MSAKTRDAFSLSKYLVGEQHSEVLSVSLNALPSEARKGFSLARWLRA